MYSLKYWSDENSKAKLKADKKLSFTVGEEMEFEPEPEPPKANVMIILTCGREFVIRDDDIKSRDDLDDILTELPHEWTRFGEIIFNTREIAAYSYLGD